MTNDCATFGTAGRFQISLAWLRDDEPVSRRPMEHGWSMGALTLTVAGVNLTAHRVGADTQDRVIWYLGPFLHWLAENWLPVFHEEKFPWHERSADPAAEAGSEAIARFAAIGAAAAGQLEAAKAWYRRHGIANGSAGGLFPDIVLRRFADDVEVSWTASPPPFAPKGFSFETEPGVARLAVADVAEPLSQLLDWVRFSPPALDSTAFQADWNALVSKIDALDRLTPERFNAAMMAEQLLEKVRASFHRGGHDELLAPRLGKGGRFVQEQAPAVAMFGGLDASLSDGDIVVLRDVLIAAMHGQMGEPLRSLVENAPLRIKPWQDGYDLAENLLDWIEASVPNLISSGFVDVQGLCATLDVTLSVKTLDTASIRGVALAGEGFAPSILVNDHSRYNTGRHGQRFTIAHELCHILHDQSRARRLAHASGPWTSPGIEKRANAFAAWLLMPPRLLLQHVRGAQIDDDLVERTARRLHVTEVALVEHLYNLGLIDDVERDDLRPAARH